MLIIRQQLTEIENLKNALADNLNTMGVAASRNEKLNTLVPKVLQIQNTGTNMQKISLPANLTKTANGTTQRISVGDLGYSENAVEIVREGYVKENGVWKFYTSVTSAIFQLNMPVLLKPKFGYAWDDDTYDIKLVYWSVDKLPANLSADIYSPEYSIYEVTLNGTDTMAEVNLSYDSNAAPEITLYGNYVTGNDINTTFEVKQTGKKLYIIGYTAIFGGTIQITLPETNYYYGDTITINVQTGEDELKHICGATWDGSSSTKWTHTDISVGLPEPVPYVSGASDYGSPYDNLYPWAGMKQVTRTGGEMVSIPKFWYKLEQNTDNNGISIKIADYPAEGFHVSPAHMKRFDTDHERDWVYVGRYHCSGSTDSTRTYKSLSGDKPKVSMTRANFRTNIHNLGSDIWQCDFAMRFTVWLLYLVEYADWNSQKIIGYGCGNNSAVQNMGYTDTMPYHTGTTKSSRTSYGLGTQYRCIEGLWDNCTDWCDGCYSNTNGLNIILKPDDFSDDSGGISAGTPSNGFPSEISVVNVPDIYPLFIPVVSNGSGSDHLCDNFSFSSSYPVKSAGGSYIQELGSGIGRNGSNTKTSVRDFTGSRIMELP